jgi:ABC-2 type transport system ATP-binding protein
MTGVSRRVSAVIHVDGLSVRFGKRYAVSSVDLEVGDGVHGLLGPNGAG